MQIDKYLKRKIELKHKVEEGGRSARATIVKLGFAAWIVWWIAGIAFTGFCVFSFIHFVLAHW